MWAGASEIYLAQSTAPMLQLLAVRPLARQAHRPEVWPVSLGSSVTTQLQRELVELLAAVRPPCHIIFQRRRKVLRFITHLDLPPALPLPLPLPLPFPGCPRPGCMGPCWGSIPLRSPGGPLGLFLRSHMSLRGSLMSPGGPLKPSGGSLWYGGPRGSPLGSSLGSLMESKESLMESRGPLS